MATTFSGEQAIEALYVGYFGRAGDPSGTNYWVGQLNAGLSISQIAASFAVQPEATSMYSYLANPNVGGTAAQTQFINQVYQDLFNHAPDAAGLAYYSAQLTAANGNPQAVGQFIINVETGAQGTDATILQNKVTVAQFFTDNLATSGEQYNGSASSVAHTSVMGTTGATTGAGSVATQEGTVSTFISGNAAAGTPITLTTGIDTVTGPNLAISGVLSATVGNNTLNVGDSLNPTGGNNSLTITDTTASGQSASTIPTLNNIQTLNVNQVNAAGDIYVLTGIAPALTTIGVSGIGGVQVSGYSGTQVTTYNVTNIGGTVTVNSNGGVANDLTNLVVSTGGATLATLNIAGSAALKIDAGISFAGVNGIVNIQAGTDTGGLTLDVSGNTGKVTFVGGTAGTEKLTISDTSLGLSGATLTGGAGTSDTLTVTGLTGGATDIAVLNKVTGFEILGLNNAASLTIDDSQITAAFNNHFALSGTGTTASVANDVTTINNLVNNTTIDVLASGSVGAAATQFSDTDIFGAATQATTLNLNIGSATTAGITNDTFTVTGWSTVNVTSNGTAANTLAFANSDNTTFNLTGADAANVTVTAANLTGDTLNASAFTGALTYTDSGKGDIISTGSGITTITELVLGIRAE